MGHDLRAAPRPAARTGALGTPGDPAARPVVNTDFRDVAHMAATTLGYTTWGIPAYQNDLGFGDFGGWALDLLQIWGQYQKDGNGADLATWMGQHLGAIWDSGMGFSYADVLADADGYELAVALKSNTSGLGVSDSMRTLYQQDGNARIARFYSQRFGASVTNLSLAFTALVTSDFATSHVTKPVFLAAAHADSMPTSAQADVCARAYAAFLANPHR